jgi:hypothetical protein
MANETISDKDCNQIIQDYIKKQKDRIKKLKDKQNNNGKSK